MYLFRVGIIFSHSNRKSRTNLLVVYAQPALCTSSDSGLVRGTAGFICRRSLYFSWRAHFADAEQNAAGLDEEQVHAVPARYHRAPKQVVIRPNEVRRWKRRRFWRGGGRAGVMEKRERRSVWRTIGLPLFCLRAADPPTLRIFVAGRVFRGASMRSEYRVMGFLDPTFVPGQRTCSRISLRGCGRPCVFRSCTSWREMRILWGEGWTRWRSVVHIFCGVNSSQSPSVFW